MIGSGLVARAPIQVLISSSQAKAGAPRMAIAACFAGPCFSPCHLPPLTPYLTR